MKKLIFLILIISMVLIAMVGCYSEPYSYHGEYTELYTVAINSLLFTKGYWDHEIVEDPLIEIIDQDSYGRVMFAYSECQEYSNANILIMQKAVDNTVYYYQDVCFAVDTVEYQGFQWTNFPMAYVNASFDDEDISLLKAANDWEQPIDLDKCISVDITVEKYYPFVDSQKNEVIDICKELTGNSWRYYYAYSDGQGRHLYSFITQDYNTLDDTYNYSANVIILYDDVTYDKSTGIMILEDYNNYQKQLQQFKKDNNWGEITTN